MVFELPRNGLYLKHNKYTHHHLVSEPLVGCGLSRELTILTIKSLLCDLSLYEIQY
jgi:hypothetical protein